MNQSNDKTSQSRNGKVRQRLDKIESNFELLDEKLSDLEKRMIEQNLLNDDTTEIRKKPR